MDPETTLKELVRIELSLSDAQERIQRLKEPLEAALLSWPRSDIEVLDGETEEGR